MQYIEFLVLSGADSLDFVGNFLVFQTARTKFGAPYEIAVTTLGGCSPGPVPLPIAWEREVEGRVVDTLLISGRLDDAQSGDLADRLRDRVSSSRRVGAISSGVWALAGSGGLDGRRAVVRGREAKAMAAAHPAVRVDGESLFVQDGAHWSCAGACAAIDMAYAMVAEDCGDALAVEVAQEMAADRIRTGAQKQIGPLLRHHSGRAVFDRLHGWIEDNFDQHLTVARLAEWCGMSERTFARQYRATVGVTPAETVELIRVAAAEVLLARDDLPNKRIAKSCGFGSEETMRRALARHGRATPKQLRLSKARREPLR